MDFAQDGEVATLHRLADRPVAEVEAEVLGWSRRRPITLILPCLASELDGDTLGVIVDELDRVPYLSRVVVGLDRADASQHHRAEEYFGSLPQRHRVLWNDGPRLRALEAELVERGIVPEAAGKGRNVWWCLGDALAPPSPGAVALHDADIVGYSRDMLARLVAPVVHPSLGYVFSKGYYVRAGGGRMHGRVARLLVAPLLRALRSRLGPSPALDYLASFRYPLAGEVAMSADAAAALRVPGDWGLEIGMLGEVHRTHPLSRICQVDVADAYDHKHRELSGEDPSGGLHRMAIDVAGAVYERLAADGRRLSAGDVGAVRAAFERSAVELVGRYQDDAVINGLGYDRDAEVETVGVFARAVTLAGERFASGEHAAPFLPSWARVREAVPDVHERLAEALAADR